MNQRSDLEAELVAELQSASNSTLYPDSRITQLIKDAYIWATQQYIWRSLVRGRFTDSVSGQEYYDYPADYREDTIVRLEVGGEPYSRRNFEDLLDYRKNNPTSTFKIFANYGRQYFIHPIINTNGNNNIAIWGAVQAPSLGLSTDKTIFSDNKQSGNEAVVRKALSVAIRRVDTNLSKSEELAAKAMLAELNQKEWATTQRDKRIQHPKFAVPDFFAGGSQSVSPIGRFSYNPAGIYS